MAGQTEEFVHRFIVEAADAGGARAGGFRLQIENLPDHSGLPEQPAIEPVTPLA